MPCLAPRSGRGKVAQIGRETHRLPQAFLDSISLASNGDIKREQLQSGPSSPAIEEVAARLRIASIEKEKCGSSKRKRRAKKDGRLAELEAMMRPLIVDWARTLVS